MEMDRAGGSGLLLTLEDLRPVEAGDPDSEEVSWSPLSSDLGEAGASLGLRTGCSESGDTGEVGDRGLDTEPRDSLLSCLLTAGTGFVFREGGGGALLPKLLKVGGGCCFSSATGFLAILDFVKVSLDPGCCCFSGS